MTLFNAQFLWLQKYNYYNLNFHKLTLKEKLLYTSRKYNYNDKIMVYSWMIGTFLHLQEKYKPFWVI